MLSDEMKLIISFIVCLIVILIEQFILKLDSIVIILATATYLIIEIVRYFKAKNNDKNE